MGTNQLKVDRRGLEQRILKNKDFPFSAGIVNISYYIDCRFCHHWHEDPEFTVIVDGEMFYQVNDRVLHLKKGQAVFVNSNMLHSGWNEQSECVYLPINFCPSILCGESNRKLVEKYISPILKSQSLQYIVFDPEKSESEREVISVLSELYKIYKSKDTFYEIKIQRLLLTLWELIFPIAQKSINEESDSSSAKNIARIKKAIDYVESNFAEYITLDELARACGLSRSEFCRCFKKIMNDTPMEYLAKARIRKSLPMLLTKEYSVTQIAMLCGFSGSSYFSECFRKYMFCSPLEYVKNTQSDK